jgi:hypothetical protein
MVTEGRITRSGDSQASLLRDNVVVVTGKTGRCGAKDDVSEVKTGFELASASTAATTSSATIRCSHGLVHLPDGWLKDRG